jgi:transcriptional regulator with XRE-family HTH domain
MEANEKIILGTNIKAERVRKRLSQAVLAEKIGISEGSMARIEQGKQVPSAFIVFHIASMLEITIDELFKGI